MIRLGKNLNITAKLKNAILTQGERYSVSDNVENTVWNSMWVYFRNALRNTVRYNLMDMVLHGTKPL